MIIFIHVQALFQLFINDCNVAEFLSWVKFSRISFCKNSYRLLNFKMADLFTWVIFLLNILVICVQVLAVFLLMKVKQDSITGSQKYLLVSLCISELVYSVIHNVTLILSAYNRNTDYYDLWMFRVATVMLMDIWIMICITTDRFFQVYFSIKYPLYWKTRKTLALIMCLGGILLFSYILLLIYVHRISHHPKGFYLKLGYALTRFVYPIFDALFICVASITYYYIFKQIKKKKNQLSRMKKPSNKARVTCQRQLKNRFKLFVPSLTILTFILFMIVPHMLQLCFTFHLLTFEEQRISYILIPVGFLADPVICIFNLSSVRKQIRRMLRRPNEVAAEKN